MAILKMGNKTLFTQDGNDEPVINNNVNINQAISASKFPSGTIIQTKYAEKKEKQNIVGAANIYPIEGLIISITPRYSTSKLVLLSMITHSATYVSSYGFLKDGVAFGGNNNTNSNNSVTTLYWGQSADASFCWSTTLVYQDNAVNTDTRTYQVAACASWSTGSQTLRINDRSSDMLSTSTFIVMEIV